MKVNILKCGDKVLNVTTELLAIERANGEVDIFPIAKQKAGIQIDENNVLTIGYDEDSVQTETVDGVTIMSF